MSAQIRRDYFIYLTGVITNFKILSATFSFGWGYTHPRFFNPQMKWFEGECVENWEPKYEIIVTCSINATLKMKESKVFLSQLK